MPKYRQLHLKILDSSDFAEMPDDFTRVVWMLLILIVDSEGRGIFNPAWIRSKMFPLRPDVSLETITKAFEWFSRRGMIAIYCVKGKYYFYLPTFKDYQSGLDREARSVLPEPELLPTNSGQTQEQVLHSVSALVSELNMNCIECVKEDDPFQIYTNWFREITRIDQGGKSAVDAVNAVLEFHPIKEDMQAGYNWTIKQKPVKYWGQIVGPTRTAMSKRLAKGNGNEAIPPGYEPAEKFS